jgi:hypothetical protein
MTGEPFEEDAFFRALSTSGARVLLIGRRALIALGIPVLTAGYDLWVHRDDIERLNDAVVELELYPSHAPDDARARGRYVLENGDHVDVLVARAAPTKDGVRLDFEDAWTRRLNVTYAGGLTIAIPSVEDLITTKRWAMREKDIADIQLLEALREEQRGGDE